MGRSTEPDQQRRVQTTPSRRAVLAALAGVAGLGLGSAYYLPSKPAVRYAVVQAGRCVPVTPLSGDESVVDRYGLRVPSRYGGGHGGLPTGTGPFYESVGTIDLQRIDTTTTFLYEGTDGLSLVVIHDHVDDGGPDGSGGSATWTLTGLPDSGSWVVRDSYLVDGATDVPLSSEIDRWDVDGSTHTIDWTWGRGSTDGGAFRGLGDAFDVTIEPAYNESATLWGHKSHGRLTDWHFLSAGSPSPTRHSLALDQPITVRSRSC